MVKVQVAVLPEASVAVQVTVVTPTGKQLPEGGLHTTVTPGQLSLAVVVKFTTVQGSPGVGGTAVMLHGQVMTGGCVSLTVMVNVQLGPPPPGAALVPRIWKILSGPPEVGMQVVFLTSPILAQS